MQRFSQGEKKNIDLGLVRVIWNGDGKIFVEKKNIWGLSQLVGMFILLFKKTEGNYSSTAHCTMNVCLRSYSYFHYLPLSRF